MRSLTYEKAKLCPKHRGVLPEAMRYFANGGRKEKKNEKKNAFSFGNSNKSRIFLHPQSRNDGGIAQLVRAHDS